MKKQEIIELFQASTKEIMGEISARFQTQDAKFDARFRRQDAKMDSRFQQQDVKFENIENRFNEQDAKLDSIKNDVTGLHIRFEQREAFDKDIAILVKDTNIKVNRLVDDMDKVKNQLSIHELAIKNHFH